MVLGRTRKRQVPIQFPGKSGIKVFLFIVFLASSVFFVNRIKEQQHFSIKQVSVYGVKHLDQQEVQHLIEPLVRKGFFAINVEQIKEQILQMPWVSEASVRRIWPDQISIAVIERNPIARWNSNSLLSSAGEIFTPPLKTHLSDIPQFLGPEGEQIHMLQYYAKITNLVKPLHLKIARLELTHDLSWNIAFENGMKVNLGYKDILTRVHHFVKVYPKIVGGRGSDVDYIDLRYQNGLAVRWKTVL